MARDTSAVPCLTFPLRTHPIQPEIQNNPHGGSQGFSLLGIHRSSRPQPQVRLLPSSPHNTKSLTTNSRRFPQGPVLSSLRVSHSLSQSVTPKHPCSLPGFPPLPVLATHICPLELPAAFCVSPTDPTQGAHAVMRDCGVLTSPAQRRLQPMGRKSSMCLSSTSMQDSVVPNWDLPPQTVCALSPESLSLLYGHLSCPAQSLSTV